jgi:integrase/recombinase XerC/integrase/recombinase XerD
MILANTNTAAPLIPSGPSATLWTYETMLSGFIADQPRAGQSSKALYERTLRYFFLWIEAERAKEGGSFQDVTNGSKGKKALKAAETVQAPTWGAIQNRPFPNIPRREVVAYRNGLEAAGKSSLTIGGYLTAIRQLFAFAEGQGFTNAARGIPTPTREQAFRRRALTLEQVNTLLDYADTCSPRERAIIAFYALTGCRPVEGVRANVGDIAEREGKCILFVQGKGKKEKDAFVVLIDAACEAITEYLRKVRKIDPIAPTAKQAAEPLFTGSGNRNNGERLTTRTISGAIKAALRAIGLDARCYSAHSLRHTVGTLIYRYGGAVQAQQTLRHSSPATTQIYARAEMERQRIEQSGEAVLSSLISPKKCAICPEP